MNKGWLSMPPNSQPVNPTHGGTSASQTLAASVKDDPTTTTNRREKAKTK